MLQAPAIPLQHEPILDLIEASRTDADRFPFDVAVVGLGHVGLSTGLAFAAAGSRFVGIDRSTERLRAISSGHVDLLHPDRERLVRARKDNLLVPTDDVGHLKEAAAVIVCVPTSLTAHLVPDLEPLQDACASVVRWARIGQVLILTSTGYVGTTRDLLVEPLERRGLRVGRDVYVAFSPERIEPGNDSFSQETVARVVGGATPECARRATRAVSAYVTRTHRVSSPEVAELTKLYENTFRAVNVALANELADICRNLNLRVVDVIQAAKTKPYGFMPFLPGPGIGGGCMPCDPHYLLWQLKHCRLDAPLIQQAMASNAARPRSVVDRVLEVLSDIGRPVKAARVLVVGVAYKPGVEDIRESPSLEVLQRLVAAGVAVDYSDPLVPVVRLSDRSAKRSVPEPEAIDYDALLLMTLHPDHGYEYAVRHPRVLDVTYEFSAAAHRITL